MSNVLEQERQSLLTFRLCTAIVVLTAVLAWMLVERYSGGVDAEEATNDFVIRATVPLTEEPERIPNCGPDAAAKLDSGAGTKACPPTTSKIETPAKTTVAAGSKTKIL